MKKAILALLCLVATACTPIKIGPRNLNHDSYNYNRALSTSVDAQLLLNIVRLRYRDTPTFLQVGVVSASYENELVTSSDFKLDAINRKSTFGMAPKLTLTRLEKPTTTFQPVRGEGFVKEFLSPVSLEAIVLLNGSGWDIQRILRCCAQRLNNVKNAPTASGPTPSYAPDYVEFLELCDLFSELERLDAVDIVVEQDSASGEKQVFLVFDRSRGNYSTFSRIAQLLDIEYDLDKIQLVAYHGKRQSRDHIVVDMRSPISVLYYLSQAVNVPQCDEIMGKVTLTEGGAAGEVFDWNQVLGGIVKVHSCKERCHLDPFVWIKYRGTIFYIDDSDLDSKTTFSLLSQLFALQIRTPEIPSTTFTIPLTN